MKKLNLLLLTLLALWGATATADVVFDETNFPDENFREALMEMWEEDWDLSINEGDILTDSILSLSVDIGADDYFIHSIKGIEYLTGLNSVNIKNNYIEEFDFSHNTRLVGIDIMRNPIKSINVTGCTLLTGLSLGLSNPNENYGHLDGLDLSTNTRLRVLSLFNVTLPDLDLTYNTLLETLYLQGVNNLNYLNLSHLKFLRELQITYCDDLTGIALFHPDYTDLSQLTLGLQSLAIGGCDNLTELDCHDLQMLSSFMCSDNNLSSIDVSNCTAMTQLSVANNNLNTINWTNCPIANLTIRGNNFSNLDISDLIYLEVLDVRNNPLIDITGLERTNLKTLWMGNTLFESLDFIKTSQTIEQIIASQNTNLRVINLEDKPNLSSIEFAECSNLDSVSIRNCPELTKIYAAINNIKYTDFQNLPNITSINLEFNSLTSFDISGLPSLQTLHLTHNHLNAFDAWNSGLITASFTNNGRQIQVYSTDVDGAKQYYIPLATTAAHKGIKDLIEQENNYEDEDTGFDWSMVMTESISGATLGELDGEQVLWLDATTVGAEGGLHRVTYNYRTTETNTETFYLDWAEATVLRGDVTGDGKVDINDVTLLIDAILGKSVEYNATAADCNTASGDGTIDINDVTALINYVLTGNW